MWQVPAEGVEGMDSNWGAGLVLAARSRAEMSAPYLRQLLGNGATGISNLVLWWLRPSCLTSRRHGSGAEGSPPILWHFSAATVSGRTVVLQPWV